MFVWYYKINLLYKLYEIGNKRESYHEMYTYIKQIMTFLKPSWEHYISFHLHFHLRLIMCKNTGTNPKLLLLTLLIYCYLNSYCIILALYLFNFFDVIMEMKVMYRWLHIHSVKNACCKRVCSIIREAQVQLHL